MELKNLVVVVCKGNIHRSVIAEFCLNKVLTERRLSERIVVVSRGLQGTLGAVPPRGKNLHDYPLEWSLNCPVLEEIGIDISSHRRTPIDVSIVEKAALILVADRGVLIDQQNSLLRQFPLYGYKMRLFRELEGKPEDVPDCGGSTDPLLHRQVIELINRISKERIDTLLAYIQLFACSRNA